jgi:outer membrane protein OmpA-like peptidoglycan-associated protein
MKWLGAALAGALVLASAAGARAQSTTSADDIINSLRAPPSGPTRGIRPATTAPEDEPPPAATHAAHPARHQAAVTAPDSADGPSVKLVVDFRTGSAELTPGAEHQLDQLGRALTSPALASFKFRVEGHTDTVGNPEANKTLSARRAEAVATYLEQKFAVDAARLEPVGLGQESLLVPTPDQTPEPRNRRVRIVNVGS